MTQRREKREAFESALGSVCVSLPLNKIVDSSFWLKTRFPRGDSASCCAHTCHAARSRSIQQHSKPRVPGFRDCARNDLVEAQSPWISRLRAE